MYFEVDSILPGADERFKFLEKSFKDHSTETGQLVFGHRLKTIRLKGQISQGLALPLTLFPEITSDELDTDLTNLLKIQKYEIPQSSRGSQGQRTGPKRAFPSYLRKSDQERCIHQDMKVIFENGDIYKIKDICDKSIKGKILSVNLETKEISFKNILSYNVSKNLDNWYRIKTESGREVIVTDDHRVFVDKRGYIEAKDLKEGDILYTYEYL